MTIQWNEEAQRLSDLCIDLRRQLHRHPELSSHEEQTVALIDQFLQAQGIRTQIVEHGGVLGWIEGGKPGRTVLLRADIDALPIQEETGLDFASRHPGKMHACGHDGHMAMLLGLAQELDQLDRSGWKNNILLIFQPSEETVGGAKPICDTGIFEKYNVKAIFGTHLWPFIPAGSIASRPDEMMAHASEVTVTVKGKSTHCAKPDEGIDALAIGAELLCRLYAMEKKIAPNQYRILKFGNFHAGTVRNILPETAVLEGSYRSFQDATFDWMIDQTKAIMRQLEQETGCQIVFDYTEGYPAVINDAPLFAKAQALLPQLQVLDKPEMIAEDFAFYQRKIPGVFFFLGTGTGIALHNCHFNFDEQVLQEGIKTDLVLMNIDL